MCVFSPPTKQKEKKSHPALIKMYLSNCCFTLYLVLNQGPPQRQRSSAQGWMLSCSLLSVKQLFKKRCLETCWKCVQLISSSKTILYTEPKYKGETFVFAPIFYMSSTQRSETFSIYTICKKKISLKYCSHFCLNLFVSASLLLLPR